MDASSAQTSLGTASSNLAAVHIQVLAMAAALASATGQLTSIQDANSLTTRSMHAARSPDR